MPGAWDPVRGEVRFGDAVPVGVRDQDYPGEIAVFPDGRFVYVSVRARTRSRRCAPVAR
ncbi:hypothetical protein [Amycolatopsis thermoflava]|uniref:hypothetical protein n=1 Tax=Amycolatopsis thermoflava TaxID=84480 RepID=UPI0037F7C64B